MESWFFIGLNFFLYLKIKNITKLLYNIIDLAAAVTQSEKIQTESVFIFHFLLKFQPHRLMISLPLIQDAG